MLAVDRHWNPAFIGSHTDLLWETYDEAKTLIYLISVRYILELFFRALYLSQIEQKVLLLKMNYEWIITHKNANRSVIFVNRFSIYKRSRVEQQKPIKLKKYTSKQYKWNTLETH